MRIDMTGKSVGEVESVGERLSKIHQLGMCLISGNADKTVIHIEG